MELWAVSLKCKTTQMREQEGLDGPKLPGLPITASSKLGGPRHSPTYQPIVVHFLVFFRWQLEQMPWKMRNREKYFFDNLLVNVLAKRFHLAELGRVVVVKGVGGHSVVELLDVVRTFRAEVVDLVVVLKNYPYEHFAAIWCVFKE